MHSVLFEFSFDMIKVIFVITALIQLAKRYPWINQYSNVYPLASCIMGILGAWYYHLADPLFSGILMGTVASGMYKVIKESIVKQLESQNTRGPNESGSH